MMNNVKQWYIANNTEITWFVIGFLIASGLNSLSQGNIADAGFSFLLAFANYYLSK